MIRETVGVNISELAVETIQLHFSSTDPHKKHRRNLKDLKGNNILLHLLNQLYDRKFSNVTVKL